MRRHAYFVFALALSGCVDSREFGGVSDRSPVIQQLGASLNDLRSEYGVGPVREDRVLTAVAQEHANDMYRNGTYTHRGSDGAEVGDRMLRAGYRWCFAAENISRGPTSTFGTLRLWENSPGHLQNMIAANATAFGLARAPGNYWVLVLAQPGC